MNCEQIGELLEAYALGALERSERHEVESHIANCSDCTVVLEGYLRTAEILLEVPSLGRGVGAPLGLRNSVLQAAGKEAGRLPLATRMTGIAASLVKPQAAALALSVMLIAGALIWAQHQTAVLARERNLRTELEQYIGQQEIVLEVVDSPRTTKVTLRAVEPQSTAYGKLYTRPDFSQVVALAGRMPLPQEGFVYNLWLSRSGAEELAGPMPVNENGFALILFDAGRDGPVYDAARVVRQPEGSTTPDGSVVIRWEAAR